MFVDLEEEGILGVWVVFDVWVGKIIWVDVVRVI